ncbi:unnamed protein product [Kuraishia capsulata CBS 1993]|uniref:tRNA ligase n=1 Tax=Kuraishia capsulata CBS 1993 TaxID=1382522 RepID=W6MPT0_9ASCO|nr:uncharacterized protein KUCA_T00004708001 [Kuraishia capsulata CBS 1993]CDK28724.1 unnamed protein product [Kuraishia capsulata CBS 1993]
MSTLIPFEPIPATASELARSPDQLCDALEEASRKIGRVLGKAKRSNFKVDGSKYTLDSWKFNEWEYDSTELPSHARGLFTCFDESRNTHVVAVRGYDKFFSVDEVKSTRKEVIVRTTQGPYEVSIKENGCIAFISTLPDGSLVVCSKHSTGKRDDATKNHATTAESALENQLKKHGIQRQELAEALQELGCTAVVEYCDDEFEEHVLPYKGDNSGLYLHGLNYNMPTFKTYPMSYVEKFGEKFGFMKVDYFKESNVENLFAFLEECSKTGTYKGRETEGFVVRCKREGLDFFFKYKFEEPYLLYRQFREVTKEFIGGKKVQEMKIKQHRLAVLDYLNFVIPILSASPELKENYLNNHGIISLREEYLNHRGKRGIELILEESAEGLANSVDSKLQLSKETKYVLVPVATIGCGKTTTALTMVNLFPSWSHIQNDNIPSPVGDKLVRGALELLICSPAVIIDRNNHQFRERQHLFDQFEKFGRDLPHCAFEFICLNYKVRDDQDTVWDITTKRVLSRGDNHQSIKVETDGPGLVNGIMKGFFNRYQPVDPRRNPDKLFDLVIDLSVENENSTLNNVEKILSCLNERYPDLVPTMPSHERILDAFTKSLEYKPTITKIVKSEKKLNPQYYGISISSEVLEHIEQLLLSNGAMDDSLLPFLKQNNRVQETFHVTLIHRLESRTNPQVWKTYGNELFAVQRNMHGASKRAPLFNEKLTADICLKRLVWNHQLMCIEAEILSGKADGNPTNFPVANKPGAQTPKIPHITIGTISEKVQPVQSNALLNSLHDGEDPEIRFLDFPDSSILHDQKLFMYI